LRQRRVRRLSRRMLIGTDDVGFSLDAHAAANLPESRCCGRLF
jgi:hypothetical protein